MPVFGWVVDSFTQAREWVASFIGFVFCFVVCDRNTDFFIEKQEIL
jgi:hypothetical protein